MTKIVADLSAKATFKKRVRDWAVCRDVDIVWLGVRPMRNKWASCSTNGHLNFSSDLRAHLGNFEEMEAALERAGQD